MKDFESFTETALKAKGYISLSFINKDVIDVGALIVTTCGESLTILTRPFNRSHFGYNQWFCLSLKKGEVTKVHVFYRPYFKDETPKIKTLGQKEFMTIKHILR